jgi:two-component system OmpR family sensor kinase
MSAIDSSPAKAAAAAGWLTFGSVMLWLMYAFPGEETIPYHLIWASFGFLYGLYKWSRVITWSVFSGTTLATAIPLIKHARSHIIGWEECSEIVLMGVLVAMLIWHVNRHRLAQHKLNELREYERIRAEQREITARFGSHEVRTRLTIARGFAELIRDKTADDTVRSDATLVLNELDKASALATKLLTLVRIETPYARVPMHLSELVDALLLRWAAAADRHWTSSVRVGMILGDAERLEAAIDCLVENAVKFTVPGDTIDIRARADGDGLVLEVRDTGTGMPEADLQRVTEVFQTGSAAGDRAGSGLGLAIVKAIVESRSGSLSVASVEGRGTTVTIRIAGGHGAKIAHLPTQLTPPPAGPAKAEFAMAPAGSEAR